jgi:diguanylate cyclase (GGDEF)-like protein
MGQAQAERGNRAQILVAEDERIVARDLAATLTELGYAVAATVASGEEAIRKAAELRPDLILMDIRLADGVDGVQAAEAIREEHKIPLIYLTAHSDEETLRRAKCSEPFGYLLKPFRAAELRCVIETTLYKHAADTRTRARIETIALTDALTGLGNRRSLMEHISQLMKEGRRGRAFVLVLIDVDRFKAVNDTHGHVVGDRVLVGVAATINLHLRDIDFAARYGGDEFCLLLADVTIVQARIVLDRLRERLADFPRPFRITASLGGCAYRPELGIDSEAMLALADQALYRSKQNGGNRVEVEA